MGRGGGGGGGGKRQRYWGIVKGGWEERYTVVREGR